MNNSGKALDDFAKLLPNDFQDLTDLYVVDDYNLTLD